MSISIGSDLNSVIENLQKNKNTTSANTSALESSLKGDLSKASDKELMDVCKSFESYMLEQVMKQMKNAMTDSEEEKNDYLSMFGDQLYEEYAKTVTESGQIGIAAQLFEAMKRDYGGSHIKAAESIPKKET